MDDMVLWSMFYSSIVSMQFHPGKKEPLTLGYCAQLADQMFEEMRLRRKYYGVDRSSDRGSG